MPRGPRAGFSLIEVVLATSILLGSLIVLEELARLGRRNAQRAEEAATAQSLAEAKLNEILSGAAPLASVDEKPVEQNPEWLAGVTVEPAGPPGITQVVVTVTKADANSAGGSLGSSSSANSLTSGTPGSGDGRPGMSFRLARWVRSRGLSDSLNPPGSPAPGTDAPGSPAAAPPVSTVMSAPGGVGP